MKKQHVKLSETDKNYLQEKLSKGTIEVRVQKRINGLLYLDQGMSYRKVSELLRISYQTASTWAKRYKTDGLSFLQDKSRSGRPISITEVERAKITAIACSEAPEGYARWSLRLLADKVVELEIVDNISFKQVGNILKKTNYNHIENDNGVSEK